MLLTYMVFLSLLQRSRRKRLDSNETNCYEMERSQTCEQISVSQLLFGRFLVTLV